MSQFGDEDLNSVLFGSIPKHEDLIYLLGTINSSDNNAASFLRKAYQCQIFKCRCLIFSVSQVISSPVLGAVENIHIIISKTYYQSGQLTPHLERINIKVTEPVPLTNAVYEACLRYTIIARLAPSWNQVDKFLVRGRDFLLSTSPLDAAKLDIVINDVDMHIVFWPLRLRLPQLCPQDLQAFSSYSSSQPFFCDRSLNNVTVHVLPSLNKANVLMVSNHIPQNSLFKSYKDLRRHWKNAHGYRLPESEEGIVYVTVKFGHWFSESMTYPIMCVKARRPVFLRQLEPDLLLLQILADIHSKVPAICGYPFAINSKVRYALPKLNILSQMLNPCNLTEIKPERKKKNKEEEDSSINSLTVSQYSQPVSQYSQLASQNSQAPGNRPITQAENKLKSRSPPPFLPRLSQLLLPAPIKPLFTPVFTSRMKVPPSTSTSRSSSPPPLPTIVAKPLFGGTPMKPLFGLAQSSPKFHSIKAAQIERKNNASLTIFQSPKPKPLFSSRGEKTLLHLPDNSNKKSRNKPQVQLGVDVQELAQRKGGLDKVNTTTLIAYLRTKGVPCKVKDKKGDLVNKVLTHLNLLQTQAQAPPPASHSMSPAGTTSSQEM